MCIFTSLVNTAQQAMKHDNAPVSAAILDQAIEWQLTLGSGKATRKDKQALSEWLGIHPDHARAWRQLGELDRKLTPARGQSVRALLTQPRRSALRQTTTLATITLLVCVSLFSLHQYKPVTGLWSDYATATGERRKITLPDNSVIYLNTRSAIDVAFDDNHRTIKLRSGEIHVETAHGNPKENRPFVVETRDGSLRALGTQFIVRTIEEGGTLLTVTQSAVLAKPTQCPAALISACAAGLRVNAGKSVMVYPDHLSTPSTSDTDADAWKDGILAVNNARLDDVAREIARYRLGTITVDPAIAGLRVSGTFTLTDTDYALSTLVAVLPIELHQRTPLWISLKPGAGTNK
jgi:transmembrane sensor